MVNTSLGTKNPKPPNLRKYSRKQNKTIPFIDVLYQIFRMKFAFLYNSSRLNAGKSSVNFSWSSHSPFWTYFFNHCVRFNPYSPPLTQYVLSGAAAVWAWGKLLYYFVITDHWTKRVSLTQLIKLREETWWKNIIHRQASWEKDYLGQLDNSSAF